MKLSFVIPAYNEEAYIGKCLSSIIKNIEGKPYQFEIIVVNNASTDKTREVALSFSGVRVVDEPSKGLSKARSAGYIASTGELIANVDADAVLTESWIDTVMEEFAANPNLAALSGPFIYYDLSSPLNFGIRIFYYLGYTSYLVNRFVFRISSMLQGGNFVVRRSALEKIGGFNLAFDFYGEDTDIARRLNKAGDVKFTFDLPILSSGRRIKAEGAMTMAARYGLNHFWTIFLKRPFSTESTDIRQTADASEKKQ